MSAAGRRLTAVIELLFELDNLTSTLFEALMKLLSCTLLSSLYCLSYFLVLLTNYVLTCVDVHMIEHETCIRCLHGTISIFVQYLHA